MTPSENPDPAAGPAASEPVKPRPTPETPSMADFAEDYAVKAGLHRSKDGSIDVLKSAGGVQGIAESILPGLMFLVAFTITARADPLPGCAPWRRRPLSPWPGWSSGVR